MGFCSDGPFQVYADQQVARKRYEVGLVLARAEEEPTVSDYIHCIDDHHSEYTCTRTEYGHAGWERHRYRSMKVQSHLYLAVWKLPEGIHMHCNKPSSFAYVCCSYYLPRAIIYVFSQIQKRTSILQVLSLYSTTVHQTDEESMDNNDTPFLAKQRSKLKADFKPDLFCMTIRKYN